MSDVPQTVVLKRSLSLLYVVVYGFGTTVGAGIFVLVGKVAGVAGMAAPLSFLLAGALAGLTACSFAEMSSRFPESAGEAVYVYRGYGRRELAILVGILVMLSGIVSSATIIKGFVGYFHQFIHIPSAIIIVMVTGVLTLIACWGIKQSVIFAMGVTFLTLVGMGAVIWAGADSLLLFPAHAGQMLPRADFGQIIGVLAGMVLAFYAFIGFEDLVNVAEETQDARRNIPLAIFTTLVLTTLLYSLIILIAVLSLPLDMLAESEAPIALLYEHSTGGRSSGWLSMISMLAVIDGALIQIVMASRVAYGLSDRRWLPKMLGVLSMRTQTPVIATLMIGLVICLLAIFIPLVHLAEVTSFCLLVVFCLVNLALIKVKQRVPEAEDAVVFPLWVPICGALTSGSLVLYQLLNFVFVVFVVVL